MYNSPQMSFTQSNPGGSNPGQLTPGQSSSGLLNPTQSSSAQSSLGLPNPKQSSPEQLNLASNALSCFSSQALERSRNSYSSDLIRLYDEICQSPIQGSTSQLESFGRVIPLLICGEQSAIRVFGEISHVDSARDMACLTAAFSSIEAEEAGHELLWQTLAQQLPIPSDLVKLKRRAAVFFAKLGRADSIAGHFAQVSQLDSAVGTIMWCLESSDMATDKRVEVVANRIKREEARHVAVSRKLAFSLGVERETYQELGNRIRCELVTLLTPIADSIEGIGVDAQAMFKRISSH